MTKIEVVYTSNGESADMYVERQTEELKDAGCPNVMVSPIPLFFFPAGLPTAQNPYSYINTVG